MDKKRIAIYARVSTEHEAQLSALENQKDWYKPILSQHPEWKLVHMYVDEGITGTSAQKRPNFMKMIEDAEAGKFDMIITREVSRFARNTIDTLQYTRKLSAIGVEVFFINDNIRTLEGDGELRLTIMATLAQEESRKMSIRVRSGQETSMEKGTFYGNGNILGYDRVGKEMVINEDQAKTVRMIFDMYEDGYGIRKIQFELEKRGRLTAMGKTNWNAPVISRVLQNPFYCGRIVYHKQYVPSYLNQKKINNKGEVEKIQRIGTHEPIISEDQFDNVQKIIKGRSNGHHGVKQPYDVWTKLLVCHCGRHFNRRVWSKNRTGVTYSYQCYGSITTGTIKTRLNKGLPIEGICDSPSIPRWKMQMMAKFIFQKYLNDTDGIMKMSLEMLDKHLDDDFKDDSNDDIIKKKQAEIDKLSKRIDNLINMRADGEIDKESFIKTKNETLEKISKLQKDLEDFGVKDTENTEDQIDHQQRLELLKYALKELTNFEKDEDIPELVIEAFVRKIVVYKDRYDWYLRFSPDDDCVKSIKTEGNRKSNIQLSEVCLQQHRLPFAKVGNNAFTKIADIKLDVNDALAYRRSVKAKNRFIGWEDFYLGIYV